MAGFPPFSGGRAPNAVPPAQPHHPRRALAIVAVAVVAGCSSSDGSGGTVGAPGAAPCDVRQDGPSSTAAAVGAATVSAGVAGAYPPGPQPAGEPAGKPARSRRWTFDSTESGDAPAGFLFGRTGRGAPARWLVQAATDAPSGPHVLVQADIDRTDTRYPVAVAAAPTMRDGAVTVRCKMVSGRVDQACGLVFRYRDADHYYVTRANALEGNIRLYTVRNGRRRELASWEGPVTRGAWHELQVQARGDRLRVLWDGRPTLEHRDATFPQAGCAGVWTKADAYTLYDDLTVTPLGQ